MLPPLLLPAEHKRGVPVPAVLELIRSATRVILDGREYLPCAGAGIADSGTVHFPAAEPLVWCDNFAVVPIQVSVVLPLSLTLAERMHVALVPAVWALVYSAARVFPHGYENLPCVDAGIADSGAVHFPAAKPLAWCDNFETVPVEPSAALSLPLPLAEYTHVAPVPVVLVPVRCAI